jgi:hypothetical protein
VAITVAATLAAYTVVAGVVAAVVLTSGGEESAGPVPEYPELPTEPCAIATRSQLGAVSARMPSASFTESNSSCAWFAQFSDGSIGFLRIAYRVPAHDADESEARESSRAVEEAAEAEFGQRSTELLDGIDDYWTMEVLDAREFDLADGAVVSHVREGADASDLGSRAVVLARAERVVLEVSMSEPWDQRTGTSDYTGDEDLLISIAERAVAALE